MILTLAGGLASKVPASRRRRILSVML